MTDTHRQDQQKTDFFQYSTEITDKVVKVSSQQLMCKEQKLWDALTENWDGFFFCIISYTNHSECGEYEQAVFSLEGELHLWKGFPQTALYEKYVCFQNHIHIHKCAQYMLLSDNQNEWITERSCSLLTAPSTTHPDWKKLNLLEYRERRCHVCVSVCVCVRHTCAWVHSLLVLL